MQWSVNIYVAVGISSDQQLDMTATLFYLTAISQASYMITTSLLHIHENVFILFNFCILSFPFFCPSPWYSPQQISVDFLEKKPDCWHQRDQIHISDRAMFAHRTGETPHSLFIWAVSPCVIWSLIFTSLECRHIPHDSVRVSLPSTCLCLASRDITQLPLYVIQQAYL